MRYKTNTGALVEITKMLSSQLEQIIHTITKEFKERVNHSIEQYNELKASKNISRDVFDDGLLTLKLMILTEHNIHHELLLNSRVYKEIVAEQDRRSLVI